MRRPLACLALALLLEGCIGLPFASFGGRGRVTAAGAVTSRPERDPRLVVQAHVGAAILSVIDPGERGVHAQASYRFVDGQHDATFGATLSLRFPAGIGVGYVTAIAIADVAARTSSASSSSSTSQPSSGPSSTSFGFCERPIPYVSPDAAPPSARDLWRCDARAGNELESGLARAPDRAAAVRACRADFVIARADGSSCVCAPEP